MLVNDSDENKSQHDTDAVAFHLKLLLKVSIVSVLQHMGICNKMIILRLKH